jgi:Fe2+ transport system protein FeoA
MTLFGIEIPLPFQMRTRPITSKKKDMGDKQVSSLANAPLDTWVVVTKYLPGMPPERYAQLRAYGLAPGCKVIVLQHTPVNVIRIDHLELALERSLVNEIQVALT